MAASVAFTYNGSTTLVAVCTGLTPSTAYDLFSGDPASSVPTGTSNGAGSLTLTITDIGGLSAGDTFFAEVIHHVGNNNPVACITLKYGTSGSSDQGIGPITWSYDGGTGGTGVVSCVFPSTNAITYEMSATDGSASTPTVVGDGTTKTLTISNLSLGTVTTFDCLLYKSGTGINYADRLFTKGTASSGFDGQGVAPAPASGRVLIAFDDGPLVPDPTWTVIDQGGSFPNSFVSGYDITSGRQTLLAQTDTGSATVYINDHDLALFDPRNASSPYFGKLDGRQIMLQLYDPIAATWNSQFRGHIDNVTYDIDDASDENGDPINASIQLECVDIFDYLAGYGLTPGLDGVAAPAGAEDAVYYAATSGTVDDRIIEILADTLIDSTRSVVFSGNNKMQESKYNADESALTALRDAADAEFPFIANLYVDRFGRVVFHGRYGRFDPVGVSADAGPATWDFHTWKLGDGKAVNADATRTQIRVLSYGRGRSEVINTAIAYPANMPAAQMPSQVYADTTSITAYGKHQAPPMSDLLISTAVFDSTGRYPETLMFAELLVKNQKDPRESITAIQLKSINPSTPRAANVWSCLTLSDVSDVVNIKVGYPDGTGFTGTSPADDYFVEGRQMTVRPANATFDYVELNLELSPFVWSADTHSVFPPRA
jgi:hypothetical protein